jgi:CHASE2 domain-containing sensor protein
VQRERRSLKVLILIVGLMVGGIVLALAVWLPAVLLALSYTLGAGLWLVRFGLSRKR